MAGIGAIELLLGGACCLIVMVGLVAGLILLIAKQEKAGRNRGEGDG